MISVDTALEGGAVPPGGVLSGQVQLQGGGSAVDIEHITLKLVARAEAEHEDGESEGFVVFERFTVGSGFRLGEEERRSVPFSVTLPWETPVSELYGRPLGIVLGMRTELAVAGAQDKGDLDALAVRPLPAQEVVLEALGQLGFGFRSADLEYGRIGGTGRQLPFSQKIELMPAPQYAHPVNEIELTSLATPGSMEVVLEADKRGGFFSDGHEVAIDPTRLRPELAGLGRTASRSRSCSSVSSPQTCQRRAKACTRRNGGKSAGRFRLMWNRAGLVVRPIAEEAAVPERERAEDAVAHARGHRGLVRAGEAACGAAVGGRGAGLHHGREAVQVVMHAGRV